MKAVNIALFPEEMFFLFLKLFYLFIYSYVHTLFGPEGMFFELILLNCIIAIGLTKVHKHLILSDNHDCSGLFKSLKDRLTISLPL
jgi:Na+-translocating ferredoxin:NAD+ oxidoreductase RnfE subunit